MRLTIEYTNPCYQEKIRSVSVEVENDDIAIQQVVELFNAALLAAGYKGYAIVNPDE